MNNLLSREQRTGRFNNTNVIFPINLKSPVSHIQVCKTTSQMAPYFLFLAFDQNPMGPVQGSALYKAGMGNFEINL